MYQEIKQAKYFVRNFVSYQEKVDINIIIKFDYY